MGSNEPVTHSTAEAAPAAVPESDQLIYTPEIVEAFAQDLVTRLTAGPATSGNRLTRRFAASLMDALHDEHTQNLARLQDFFTSQSALAEALGVHRDTLRKWEAGSMRRLRATSLARVRALCDVAEEVSQHMPSDTAVGPWLLYPQPALGGRIPASMIRDDGRGAYELIVAAATAAPACQDNGPIPPAKTPATTAYQGSDVADRALEYLHETLYAKGSLPPAVIYHRPPFEHETALSLAVNEGWLQGKEETLADLVRLHLLSGECYTWATAPV